MFLPFNKDSTIYQTMPLYMKSQIVWINIYYACKYFNDKYQNKGNHNLYVLSFIAHKRKCIHTSYVYQFKCSSGTNIITHFR